jgi:putative ABC transport system permease protein
MSVWRHFTRGWRVLINRASADRDLEDEVRHFFEEAAAPFEAKGLSPDEARRAARLELGTAAVAREEVRASGWEATVGRLLADLGYASRRLRGTRGFSALVIMTLALGIGASTAIFSAVNPVLFRPLPYPHPERIMAIWDHGVDASRLEATFGTYRELADRSRTFEAFAVTKRWQPTVTGPAEPERLDGQRVSADYKM